MRAFDGPHRRPSVGLRDLTAGAPCRIKANAGSAQAIALELNQTSFDSLYLAIALAVGAVMLASDGAFGDVALANPVYRSAIRLLGA